MFREKKMIIMIAIGIVVVLGMVFVSFWFLKDKKAPIIDEQTPVAKLGIEGDRSGLLQPIETKEDAVLGDVRPLAIAFVERFGTYTNHSNFESISGLSPVMTASMLSWVESVYLPKLRQDYDPTGYFYRITARAPVVQILEVNNNSARVLVTAQREETLGTAETKEYIQTITLDLVNENNSWLVNGAYWEKID